MIVIGDHVRLVVDPSRENDLLAEIVGKTGIVHDIIRAGGETIIVVHLDDDGSERFPYETEVEVIVDE